MRRIGLIGLGILVAGCLALALLLPSLLDVEKQRPAVEAALASATGRAVSIGPMKLSVLPLPELTASGITIGEDPRFGTEPFLKAERLELRVRLWPLLRRRVRVVSVTLNRPELRLIRNREGKWSVLTLGDKRGAPQGPAPASPGGSAAGGAAGRALPSAGAAGGGFSFSAERIRVQDGTLRLVDDALVPGKTTTAEARDVAWTLRDLSLVSAVGTDLSFELAGLGRVKLAGRVGPLSPDRGGTLPFDLTLALAGSNATLAGQLTGLRGRLAIDAHLVTEKVLLREIAPFLGLAGPLLPAGLARTGEVSLDVTARGPVDEPARISIDGTAGVADLEFADPSLKQPITGIRGSVALSGDRVEISGFRATLGKSSVTGACTLTRFDKPVIDVRLDAPLLDVDDLLTLLPAAAPDAPPSASGGAPPAGGGAQRPTGAADPVAAPAGPLAGSLLKDVTIRGDLGVAKGKVMNLQVSSAKAKLALERGIARLTGISVELYGGRMGGDVTADVAAPGPPFSLTGRLDGVDFGALAADLSTDLKGLVYGTLETSLEVRGRGLDTPALRRHLTGNGTLALRDGKLTSFGMLKAVARALQAAGGRGIGEDETPFQSLTAHFDIADGKATTQDLTLNSTDLTLLGQGFVGLDLSLDLGVVAKFSPAASADMVAKTAGLKYLADGEGRLELDLRVAGTLTTPSVAVDRAMLDRAAKAVAREKAREQGKSLLRKLFEKKK